MYIFESTKFVAFDCDDTLVMWDRDMMFDESAKGVIEFKDPYQKDISYLLKPHKKHIQKLKGYKNSGWTVMVWSAGGWGWAKTVVETLGLEKHVDIVMSKPRYCYDDLPVGEGIGIRKYYQPKKEE
jgi:FMN phosphatase YigB (HAD superfamily)